jgi:hypothetical protein
VATVSVSDTNVRSGKRERETHADSLKKQEVVDEEFWAKYDDIRWAFFKESA